MDNKFVNNIMIDLDNYLKPSIKKIYKECNFFIHSYLWRDDVNRAVEGKQNHIAFRHPGSTNGHIEVDENMIIKDIVFYNDTCYRFYKGSYRKALKEKYIGTKLSLEEIEEEIEDDDRDEKPWDYGKHFN